MGRSDTPCATIQAVSLPGNAPDTFAEPGLSLVWNVLRKFGEDIKRVENLKVATSTASQITAGGRWEAPTVALLRTIYDRTRLRDANDPR